MTLPIPMQVLYAGLVGTLLALVVATAQQKWKLKVFFLLALRLAIGWQFLFEGLHKIHSHYVGETETSKPFKSDPYFKEAPGPLAGYMRAMNGDPAKIIADRLAQKKPMTAYEFGKLDEAEQAALCHDDIAKQLDAMADTAEATTRENAETQLKKIIGQHEKALKDIAETEKKEADAAKDQAGKDAAKKKADDARKKEDEAHADLKKEVEQRTAAPKDVVKEATQAAKAEFARWVYGVDRRPLKMTRITGDVTFTAPQRVHYVEMLKREKQEAEKRLDERLGTGYGIDVKKAQSARADYWNAEAELVKDIDAFVTELKTKVNDGKAMEPSKEKTMTEKNDRLTRWFLAVVGAFILFGFLTRISCVLAAGFLLLTYLTHPPFPWYTLPPGTEGNPLFINKNAVEFFALLALACMPTGKWLGIDALISYIFRGKPKPEAKAA